MRAGTLAEVLEQQKQLVAAEAQVADLEARLSAAQVAPAPALTDLSEIEAALAEAMVQVELGQGDKAEVARLEKERAAAQKQRDHAAQEADRAALLRRGLEARREAAQAEVARQQELVRVATTWHLLSELENVAEVYRDQARQLISAYGRLHGLSRALEQVDEVRARGVSLRHLAPLQVPMPNLEVLNASDIKGWSDRDSFRADAARAELERLQGAGLRLPQN